ncbi:hypothetical protein I6F30_10805 [Bradyrhizobium sp. NBAIM20]|uniref:hypothetical protein n=1 Tax=unclassified Bradyrhizobium TaxID=2631580 RepID=UPI001CD45EDE|nr:MULTISPECIES: hypothetical protein [unclassified Bradyrhizobium]MCA1411639.1 hypothetical protein [Bradyrhizobium sp. NBAIM20]MCA1461026.1 hypothetical protein [Bradyrhizobium sp. NBAIM18]
MEDVHTFQVHLVVTGISWQHVNQMVCALHFFDGVTLGHSEIPERIAYAREPLKLPVVLIAEEVVRFLKAILGPKEPHSADDVYAAGLSVSEVAFLAIPDIDRQRMVIRVSGQRRQGRHALATTS